MHRVCCYWLSEAPITLLNDLTQRGTERFCLFSTKITVSCLTSSIEDDDRRMATHPIALLNTRLFWFINIEAHKVDAPRKFCL